MDKFKLKSTFNPAGDQPRAIEKLLEGLKKGIRHQTLLGVTGSGKTFTMANVIASVQKPTLVIAHNKTLAAQLAQEYKEFFPDNAVHYFVSYYDFYQPEAYMPVTDTYIEKDAQINEEIDRLRHASTQALLTRKDVIIVASVSCIYGLGSPKEYRKENLQLRVGEKMDRAALLRKLVSIFFERTTADLSPGQFRGIGNTIDIMPVSERTIVRLLLEGGHIRRIISIDPVSQHIIREEETVFLFPAKHFITDKSQKERAIKAIRAELKEQMEKLEKGGRMLDAERLKRRTNYDIAMMKEVGYCNGIENYSRHLSGRAAGEPPDTLLSYFPHTKNGKPDFLTVVDESHVTVPQIRGMYEGDASRKRTLIEYGFRLPSALDNRPLKFPEFSERIGQVVYTSATPGEYEKEESRKSAQQLRRSAKREVEAPTETSGIVEQIIRPTGLIDPEIVVRPVSAKAGGYSGQVEDFIMEAVAAIKKGNRVMATTLTKRMAEDLSEYLKEKGIKAEYLHSDIKTLERIRILTNFRKGSAAGGFDAIIGVNLLREGLDLPEVTLIGILDADKEGFLRSDISLIQTIGRAARNAEGRVILYADRMTGSLERAIGETNRRRAIQLGHNKKHGITPATIMKKIHDITEQLETKHDKAVRAALLADQQVFASKPEKLIKLKEREMKEAVKALDFESAAILRDEIKILKGE